MRIQHLFIGRDALGAEWRQLEEEGADASPVAAEFERRLGMDDDALERCQSELAELLARSARLPLREGYPYVEPSSLDSIRRERPQGTVQLGPPPAADEMENRLRGAWQGRIAGCLLGKPVEGWRRERMYGYLKDTGRWPLADFFVADVLPEVAEKYQVDPGRAFADRVQHMVWDDDLNYSVLGMLLLERRGVEFSGEDVARLWLEYLPLLATWTAERTAYRNFVCGIAPPESALASNPYREWIGAQIRADAFGWFCPGKPELAAELAWRDSSISHVKNGIYGSMWVAAMLAAAPCVDSVRDAILAGLEQVPSRCRLAAEIREVLDWRAGRVDYDEAVERVHGRYDETFEHHWCHTIPNAMIVCIGLLWGDKDFGRSVCRAVQGCFDTDCNGATVGSVLGIMLGGGGVPGRWTAPLRGRVETSLAGMNLVEIEHLVQRSVKLYNQLHG